MAVTAAERKCKDMTRAEKEARELIKQQTLDDLLTQWELTSIFDDENIYTVIGWLMDELESRNPEAFNKWLDSDCEDFELRKYMTA